MNIFVLDADVSTCARYHCDKHVVKMILESAQMLCTALNKRGFITPYKSTHVNHPSVTWLDESFDNFQWLKTLATELNREYRHRYGREKDHASMNAIRELEGCTYPAHGLTEFAQVMPEQYKIPGDPVSAYRAFYNDEKLRFAVWTKRPVPPWIKKASPPDRFPPYIRTVHNRRRHGADGTESTKGVAS